ncbi:MAG: hypothetical protein KGI26_05915 [Thaumarchaeota archaeon]|nr:hypothetical protein [Nitrososphaerota archaeon]
MGEPEARRGIRRFLTDGLLVTLFVFAVFELSVNTVWATDHATSLTQLAYALLANHSVALGQASSTPPWTVDNFHYEGQNYSALAPGSAFLALPFMAVGFALAGGYTAYGPALVWSGTFVSLTGAIAALLVYKIAGMYFKRSTSIFLGVAFAFSTIAWPFATYFFQSDVSAMLVLASAYFALRAGRTEGVAFAPALACGLAAGAAFMVDYVDAVIVPILIAFLIVKKWGSRRSLAGTVTVFILGLVPGFAARGAYNIAIFGTPFMTTEQAYVGQSIFGKFSTPIHYGLALNLVSLSRGLLAFAPLTILGFMGYYDAFRTKKVRTEMLLMLAIFLGILLPYSAWYDPTGGLSFGPRFIVPAIPFLLLPAGSIVEQAKRYRVLLVYALYAAGAVINGMAAFVTAVPPSTGFDVSPFTTYIIPNFQTGNFDSLWASILGHPWYVGAALVAALGVAVPLIWVEAVRRRSGQRAAVREETLPGREA